MTAASNTPALRISDLRFRYGRPGSDNGFELAIPSLELARGDQVLVRGGSGSGKSTLLQLIAGLMDPHGGRIEIDGVAIHSLHGARRDQFRGRRLGMIFQTFNLLHGFSAIENVMAAMMFSKIPRSDHRKRAADLLEHLGITAPDRDPLRLSVGQQQRVAVARAVACDPALVLADEPTASLDPDNASIAVELIKAVCVERSASLLMVSHDPAMSDHFDSVLELDSLPAPPTPISPTPALRSA